MLALVGFAGGAAAQDSPPPPADYPAVQPRNIIRRPPRITRRLRLLLMLRLADPVPVMADLAPSIATPTAFPTIRAMYSPPRATSPTTPRPQDSRIFHRSLCRFGVAGRRNGRPAT